MTLVPRSRGGWWHDYVCPSHGVELEPEKNGVYPCAYGCELRGEPYAAAWLVFRHQALAREARLLAHRFRQNASSEDRVRAVQILDEYAALYRNISAAGWNDGSETWMLKGKLFSQALTEAQWAVQIADAVTALRGEFGRNDEADTGIVGMLHGLLDTVEAARGILVDERHDERSNYTAWLNAAGRALTRALQSCGENADSTLWLERTFDHIRIAVAPDGWEWEGSTYYHVFVLRAYLLGLADLAPAELPEDVALRLAAMTRVLAEIATPDGRLPALHDGPYDRDGMHREVLEICVLAKQLFTETCLDTVEEWVTVRLGAGDDGLERLLTGWFGGEPSCGVVASRGSVWFPSVGYAVLRDPDDTFQAVIDAGPHGGSHGHLDKLAVYLYGRTPWQPAPGVPPYASRLRHGYYARTTAHPTIRVDDLDQHEGTGILELWDAENGRIVVRTDDAVPGVILRRELVLAAGHLVDIVSVTATDGASHDVTLGLRPSCALSVFASGTAATSLWTNEHGDTLTGHHHASVPSSAVVVVPGRGPSDDPSAILPVADWHAAGASVRFVTVLSFDEAARPSEVDVDVTFSNEHPPLISITGPNGTPTMIQATS
jgi:hypothetical protein